MAETSSPARCATLVHLYISVFSLALRWNGMATAEARSAPDCSAEKAITGSIATCPATRTVRRVGMPRMPIEGTGAVEMRA